MPHTKNQVPSPYSFLIAGLAILAIFWLFWLFLAVFGDFWPKKFENQKNKNTVFITHQEEGVVQIPGL